VQDIEVYFYDEADYQWSLLFGYKPNDFPIDVLDDEEQLWLDYTVAVFDETLFLKKGMNTSQANKLVSDFVLKQLRQKKLENI
jgi:hypothetical protein